MEAVILAAGLSRRFRRHTGYFKLTVPVSGYPLVCYPMTSLIVAGIERIVLVVNPLNGEAVNRVLNESFPLKAKIDIVVNDRPELGNGYSLLSAISKVKGDRFIVSMADHIYPPSIALKLINYSGSVLGGDSNALYINVEEATKIHVRNGYVARIGKDINPFEYVDIGVHALERKLPFKECIKEISSLELSAVMEYLASRHPIEVADVNGAPWTELDTYSDYIEITQGDRRSVVEEVLREWEKEGLEVGT